MNWQLKLKAPEDFIKKFPEHSPLVLQLLYDRNLETQKEIDEFFNPDYESDLHDPFLMKGIKQAVQRIKQAVKNKEKIVVYGDYDADGICSTVILMEALKKIGVQDLNFHIPSRNKEGYGLNEQAVKKLAKQGSQLMISVDCGITNVEEIKLAKSLGLETIIVDHHQCPEKLPKAKVIINPHQPTDKYPFKDLAAVGVVFKLIQALYAEFKIEAGSEKWFLDLVALATVADIMPLLGENRTLVKYGLVVLAQTQRTGLKELMKVARITNYSLQVIDNGNGQKEHKVNGLDSWTLAFALAPRINVAARLDSVEAAYQLLVTRSEAEAKEIAQRLEGLNRQRQQMVNDIVKEVERRLVDKEIPKIICEGGDNWSTGLVGLIAGKIKDKYHRPVFACNLEKDEVRCSARSIPGFDIVKVMSQCSSLLEGFGGHPMAAGITIKKQNLAKFQEKILKIAEKELKEEDLIPQIAIDAELTLAEVSWSNYDQVQKFAPFGKKNPEPLFLVKNLEIVSLRAVGKNNQHLKMELFGPCSATGSAMKKIKAIGFRLGDHKEKLKVGDCLDVVFEFIADQWNGTRNLQLKIIDIQCHPSSGLKPESG